MPNKRSGNPPLGLATLAGLCPENWEVEIIDENIESIPLQPRADIIGVCGMGVQFKRQNELVTFYRQKGYFVVAGGSYASLCPENYESLADTVVAGEAEYVWPEFCRDFEAGAPKSRYLETDEVDITDSPIPRLDLLKLDKYHAVSLQFSRGCPFRCEFCDIIVMFGRKPRTKSMEQVGRELDLLRKLNVYNVFFVDDNLIGNKQAAKELMRFLKSYQMKYDYWFHFGTEVSLNLAQDDELLRLFREANFEWVFIGIESPDEESLKETKKYQNTRQDMLASVRTIYSHGIQIAAGFIIGFDNDTTAIFEKQYQFITKSGIQAAMIGLLIALPRTPLYDRLKKENRLIPEADHSDNSKLSSNVLPKQMSYDEMISGYRTLYNRLLEHRNMADRIKNKIRHLRQPAYMGEYSKREHVKILGRFIFHGLLQGGFSRMYHFLRSLPLSRPRLIPLVISDWVIGISMRDYVDRNFVQEFEKANHLTHDYLKLIEKSLQRYLQHGALEVSLSQVKNAAANLSVSMKGSLDRDFFTRATRHLEKILKDTTSSITLHIEELHEAQLQHLNRLLKRLSRYGDRISIAVHDNVKEIVHIDSSIFYLDLKTN
ncbi:MAG: radical SAM protein [Ignavibacteria bacterium]|nr:radical SAM protein [Ignavibacteria bacterium]